MSLSLAITKAYPGFTLDMRLRPGRSAWRCSGPQVAAKGCTLRCIAGVETPDKGRIVVNGITFFDSEAGINRLATRAQMCPALPKLPALSPTLLWVRTCAPVWMGVYRQKRASTLPAGTWRYLVWLPLRIAFLPSFRADSNSACACSHDRGASRHLHV